jgi:hypothetical protein
VGIRLAENRVAFTCRVAGARGLKERGGSSYF